MTDEPVTEQEVQSLLDSELVPPRLAAARVFEDWLRLKRRLAEAERERDDWKTEAVYHAKRHGELAAALERGE